MLLGTATVVASREVAIAGSTVEGLLLLLLGFLLVEEEGYHYYCCWSSWWLSYSS